MRQIHRSLLPLLMAGVAAAALGSTSSRLVDRPAVAGESLPQVLRGQALRPLSLASGDFDQDGVPDLAAGFGTSEGGVVVLYRGNVDSLYPNSPEARQRRVQGSFVGEPFLPMDRVLVLTAPPDFLFAGDFDADGHADLAAAAREGTAIHLLSGDGTGAFRLARRVGVPGGITAMTQSDLGRRDGLPDLAVAAGSNALVFQGSEGALSAAPAVVALPSTAVSLSPGDFSADRRRPVALMGRDGRVLLLETDAPRSWKLVEAETREELDAASSALARPAEAASLAEGAVTTFALRVDADATSGEVVLKSDGTLSISAPAAVSTFVVDVTTDLGDTAPGNGTCADVNGDCSLRAAIQEANAHAGNDTITFAVPGAAVPAIVTPGMPSLTDTATIDGTTQAAGRVMITGTTNGTLLTLAADGCVLRGLVVNGTGNFGLKIQSSNNVVEGNFFGTTSDGTALQGGIFGPDILVVSGTNNLIGGTAAPARNVIAGGSGPGIRIDGTSGTIVRGNYVGTDVTGTVDLGVNGSGIRVFTGTGNTIGGAAPGAGNLVSGNSAEGISIETVGNVVQGNRVGTDASGSAALPNQGIGIRCYFSGDATVGGTAPGMGNLVAGNGSHGVSLQQNAPADITIQGNRIGTDLQGAFAIPNQGHGIQIVAASQSLIGGTTAAARNLISGNLLDGIFFTKFITVYPTGNLIHGNFIGTDATGTVAIPNLGSGISFEYALGTLVGGATSGQGNVISGNHDHGIRFGGITDASANPNHVRGNLIGSTAFGTGALGNGQAGVYFYSNAPGYDAGGTGPGEPNLIAFNAGAGIASVSGRRVRFHPNSIHSNAGLGVDRGNDGPTPNLPPGTFVFENSPILTAASTSGSGTAVSGTLTSGYAATFTIQVFANPACDSTGYGEARQYLGATTVNTAAGADTPFSANLPSPIPAGSYVTALATAPDDLFFQFAASELSFCKQVSGTPPPGSVPLGLYAVAPARGGNTGPVTVYVSGQGIVPGATIRLELAGQTDRIGTVASMASDGSSLTATFPLAGAALGVWDVVVTNPDTSTATLAAAFTVESGREPEIFGDVLGRGLLVVRAGREQTFFILYGNRGNVDSEPAEFRLTIPRQLKVTFVEELDGSVPVVSIDKPTVTGGTGESGIHFYVLSIPAGSSRTLAFRVLTVEADPGEFGQEVEMSLWFMSDADLGPIVDAPHDSSVVLSPTVLVEDPGHFSMDIDVSGDSGSGTLHFDMTTADVAFEADPTLTRTVSGGNVTYIFRAAFSNSPPTEYTATVEGPQAVVDAALLYDKLMTSNQEKLDKGVKGQMLVLSGLIDADGNASLDNFRNGAQVTQMVEVGSMFVPAASRTAGAQIKALNGVMQGAWQKKICATVKNDPFAWYDFLGVQQTGGLSCEDVISKLEEKFADPKVRKRILRPLRVFLAIDPNEKSGPSGSGAGHYVTGADPLPYTITFENLETATAAAQEVVVTDQLDASKLELGTFALGPIAFGSHVLDVPPGLQSFTGDVDLRPDIDLIARVTAAFDATTGLATWHFFSLDPATGQPTSDPILGFLPPNVTTPEGEGHVTFTIQSKTGLASGTEIHNQGSIVFDANPVIVTADWSNTIDVTTPSSQVAALPASSCTGILVSWSGADAHSGIASYDVFASVNGGPFVLWIEGFTSTTATYYGTPGFSYSFYSVARDAAGNEEAPPGSADATTVVQSPSPLVDSLTPPSGPAAGAPVALTGSGFEPGASVTVGGSPASGETVTDPASMSATFPSLAAGALYDVVVANVSSCSDTLSKGWFADFNDVPDSHGFHDFVEKIFRRGVTAGCTGGNYCPDNPVTRAQMAVFLIKAKYNLSLVPATATGALFTDVPVGSFAADWIEQLASEGVTGGCGGGNYCPSSSVTRKQMAVFLLKSKYGALYLPPPAVGVFADVPPGDPFAPWIEQLAAEGITGGCGGGNYCPNNPVTRGQMAVFLSKTFSF